MARIPWIEVRTGLQEARRLLLGEGLDATSAAYRRYVTQNDYAEPPGKAPAWQLISRSLNLKNASCG